MRPDPKTNGAKPPSAYLGQFCFDTILFSPVALNYLIEFAGGARVLLDTDYPFDMGDQTPVALVKASGRTLRKVLGDNAAGLLGVRC